MERSGFFFQTMRLCHLKLFVFSVLVAITLGANAQISDLPEPVPLPSSELRSFHSEIMDQDLQIFVQLPLNYISDGSVKYPVWYMTDGNRSFPMTANISTIIGFPPASLPQVIVIGIAYDITDMSDWARWRTRDLTPVVHRGTEQYWNKLLRRMTGDTTIQVKTGGAPRFLSFICDELIPFIESEYPVSKEDRTLGGYSYGGLFTLFALFERPAVFQRYFAGSPTIVYANGVLFEMEQALSERQNDLNARLFMSFGQLEDQHKKEAMKRMAEVLKSHNYPGLDIRTHIFAGETHTSAYAASVMRAFNTLYRK